MAQTNGSLGGQQAEQLISLMSQLGLAMRSYWASAAGQAGLGETDLIALSRLAETSGMTGVELRQALGITSSSVSELADRLEVSGLLTRSRNGPDRRHVTFSVTRRGRRVAERALGVARREVEVLLKDRGERQVRSAIRLLTDVSRALAESQPER